MLIQSSLPDASKDILSMVEGVGALITFIAKFRVKRAKSATNYDRAENLVWYLNDIHDEIKGLITDVDKAELEVVKKLSDKIDKTITKIIAVHKDLSDDHFLQSSVLEKKINSLVEDAYKLRFVILDKCFSTPEEELVLADRELVKVASAYGMRNHQQLAS